MQNKYIKLLIIFLAVVIVVPQVALASWWNPFSWGIWNSIFHFQKIEQQQTQPVVCTMEAKLCPDGSSVSRQGPKCEFAQCPEQKNITNNVPNIVGGDKDAHGCIGSAGYTWCEEKKKCLRSWEEKCEVVVPVVDATAGWKTYTNSEHGFRIKYPSDWSVDQAAVGAFVYCDYQKRNLKPCTGLNGVGIGAPGPSVQVRVDKITLEEFKKDWVVTKQENYLLDGVLAQKIVGGGVVSMGLDQNVIFAVKDGYSYIISYTELAPIQNQILSTFKFIP